MITLAEAQGLRDAGYKQVPCTLRCYSLTGDGGGTQKVYQLMPSTQLGFNEIAAPNSDELIAAIQERWNPTDIDIEKAGEMWWILVPGLGMAAAKAPTLRSALVDLYEKLAEDQSPG